MTSLNHELAVLSNGFDKNFMFLNPDRNSFILFDVKDKRETAVADWCSMALSRAFDFLLSLQKLGRAF